MPFPQLDQPSMYWIQPSVCFLHGTVHCQAAPLSCSWLWNAIKYVLHWILSCTCTGTAGLAESNGSLLPGLWRDSLHVTCGLTACTPGSAPGPTLGNKYGKTLPYLLLKCIVLKAYSGAYIASRIFLSHHVWKLSHAYNITNCSETAETVLNALLQPF